MSKNRVIVEAVLAGQSHAAVARQYGISTVWVGKLVARWRAGGWDARRQPVHPPEVESERDQSGRHRPGRRPATRVDRRRPGRRPAHPAAHLQRTGLQVPSVATIWRILTRDGLVTPEPRKRPKRSYLRFQADLPNECWQSDFTHWPLADGTDTEILTWLDDHSRFALSLTAHTPVTGDDVVTTFRAAVDPHGIPAATLTDNGHGVHHQIPARPQQLRTRTGHPRRRAEERPTQPPPDPRQSGTIPADPEEVAARPATRRHPRRTAAPARHLRRPSTTPPDPTDPWAAAPPRRPTPPAPKPPPPAVTGTGASATTRSTRPGASPCATPHGCTTSAWATNTTAPPCASSSTTCTSPSSTPTPARSSATSPSTPPATTNPSDDHPDHPKAAPDEADARRTPPRHKRSRETPVNDVSRLHNGSGGRI